MTGILGFKAYRVLDSSKLILIVLGAFRVAITIFMLIYLAKSRFTRRLSGLFISVLMRSSSGSILQVDASHLLGRD